MLGMAVLAVPALAGCGSGTKTRVTVTRTVTTTATTATTTTTTTTALPGAGRPAVSIGDKNTFPEQFVLGALYEQALAAKGFNVSLNRNIGPTEVSLQALHAGSLGMYPEYINVWDSTVAGDKHTFSSARAAYAAGQGYAVAHNLALLKMTPFSDTVAIGVTLTYAVRHGLSTIGDLRKVADKLTIGGPPEFENATVGLAGVEEVYGFAPAAFTSLPEGEQYVELGNGKIQAAFVDTTDGQLLSDSYALLRDPAHVFGFGNVVPVVSQTVLANEGPAFLTTINAVSALLSTPVMRQLNYDVGIAHEDPTTVAKQFLETHHLAPAS